MRGEAGRGAEVNSGARALGPVPVPLQPGPSPAAAGTGLLCP